MDDVEGPSITIGAADVTIDAAGIEVIKLSGEIDMSNVDSLRAAIEPVLDRAPSRVDFDLSELDFMDSSGIALLLRVAAKSETVHLRGPSALVRRMIEATGLSDVLLIEP
ncbi:MAG: STAS domain-containing protein [Acidimicrobiia bacterium]